MARLPLQNPFWAGKRKPFLIATVMSCLMLILLFLSLLSYLYGSLFRASTRTHALTVLAVDYDGGLIGQALSTAYQSLQADSFPTLRYHTSAEYPDVQDLRRAVCRGHFWAAIFVHAGASTRLQSALQGGQAASSYNASDAITYIWNENYYPTVQQGYIKSNLETLIAASGVVYEQINEVTNIRSLNTTDAAAISSFVHPITSSSINLHTVEQGTRVLYNTITLVLPIMQQFFLLMAINGISGQFGIYGRLLGSQIGLIRMTISIVYTFIASLTVAGYIWAFREDWAVNGVQFVLTWMVMWLYMHINFCLLDAYTAFVPTAYLTFGVLAWVVISVTSTIFPFELNPGFYRWGYALPAHEVYSTLVQIWGRGCNNQLYRALPILFSWEVVGLVLAVWGSFRRNHAARLALDDLKQKEDLEKDASSNEDSAAQFKDSRKLHERLIEEDAAGVSTQMPFAGALYMSSLSRSTTY